MRCLTGSALRYGTDRAQCGSVAGSLCLQGFPALSPSAGIGPDLSNYFHWVAHIIVKSYGLLIQNIYVALLFLQ